MKRRLWNTLWRPSAGGSRDACRPWLTANTARRWLWLSVLAAPLPPAVADVIDDAAVRGCAVRRDGVEVRLTLGADAGSAGSVEVPRFCTPLRAVRWAIGAAEPPTVHPEPRHWVVRWRELPPACREIVLVFDEAPVLPAERVPIAAAGDGSLMLPASRADTQGTTLRYEPQPHKNTVGYWAVASDSASWEIALARPGTYAVAILQGCGVGQGGSTAVVRLESAEQAPAALSFTTVETGHFQNFRWLDVGTLVITAAGRHRITITPERIAKAALCDIRAVSLVPQASAGAGATASP